jgi:hypothetical protein
MELKRRGAPFFLITEDGPLKNLELLSLADYSVLLPLVPRMQRPQVALIPLQLLACRLGILKGLDVDNPNGLLHSSTKKEKPKDFGDRPSPTALRWEGQGVKEQFPQTMNFRRWE